MKVYTYVDYVGLVSDRRSTLGYCTFFFENLVAWSSKKESACYWIKRWSGI